MRHEWKRVLAVLLSLSALGVVLDGCGTGAASEAAPADDVVTMTAVSGKNMTVTIRAEYNVNNEAIRSALAEKFPDVNFISVFHCAQETQYELRQSLASGSAEDLVISPNMKAVSDLAPDALLDLSADSYVEAYDGAALENCAIDGKVYYLPGPSSLYGIVYDKTLFARHGWSVPHSYSEFLALVRTIGAAGIRAVQPTCKYARQAQMVLTMFDYDETFGGVENFQWLKEYQIGAVSMQGHVEPALARYRELNRAGVIVPGDFDVQPGNRSAMLYNDHACAMILECEQADLYAQQAGSDHEYGIFPFWCGDGPDSDYLMSLPAYYVGISSRLDQKGNEKKLAKVKEILSYISTPDGQLAINGGAMRQISNVQGTPYTKDAFNSEIQATIAKGNLVPEVELMASGNNNAAEKALKADLKKYLEGSLDAAALGADCDAARTKALSAGIDRGQRVGSAKENFTCLQTGLFIADALRDKAGADIGLCLVGSTHCGMVGRIYQGDLYASDVSTLSLSVGQTSGDPNDKKLWRVSMTGEELLALLKEGYTDVPQDNVPNIPYYVASGLKIKFAPWREDKLVSVSLADGSALSPDQTYTVALWGWPFDSQCPGTVDEVFPDSCDDILTAAIAKTGTLSPLRDGRFTLVY